MSACSYFMALRIAHSSPHFGARRRVPVPGLAACPHASRIAEQRSIHVFSCPIDSTAPRARRGSVPVRVVSSLAQQPGFKSPQGVPALDGSRSGLRADVLVQAEHLVGVVHRLEAPGAALSRFDPPVNAMAFPNRASRRPSCRRIEASSWVPARHQPRHLREVHCPGPLHCPGHLPWVGHRSPLAACPSQATRRRDDGIGQVSQALLQRPADLMERLSHPPRWR
jgi:hypothetical protein